MKEKRKKAIWVEKKYTLLDLVEMAPEWMEYLAKKIMDNEHSPLCGLPKRKVTEVHREADGGYLIRYQVASLSK